MSSSLGNKEVMAENLKRYMDMYGEDRKTIAEIAGVSYFTVRDWLVAKNYPRIDKIEILARHWKISKADLVEPLENREEKPQKVDFVKELSADDIDWSWASAGGKPISERAKANILAAFYDEIQEYKKNHPNKD
ncbi:MAG: transcriptional regulator [Lactococcus cremoris]|uniref:Transcriptional regulator n=1 Tax=Lactococcus lactis TaxID=1358 RepID=A0A552Z197_9LACT|nr:transcriptional regulator [Lactococcus lactis]MDN6194645.1 transcriptional regulator [Alkalibacterium sp.]EHE93766.1 Repressor lexA [Lactococcus lactis subsp. lactis CNCM I-1631]MCT0080418.1 transcriptional regulator [Lactococcus lactis subsp. lactis]MCT3085070.1 transcriptional regulator [Lactococcus lactis]MCT3122805.1 transcriptional regulator [Lactococcus lactis]